MWVPHDGGQDEFCRRGEFEILYGGQAGPGKTDCLIALATRFVTNGNYRGLLLRRTFPQLREVIDRCWALYPTIGGTYRSMDHRWTFPSGASIELGHMQHESDQYNYQGREFQFVGFDELTQFTEGQYLYLFSRCRSTDPSIPSRVRSTSNPGGIGHHWVRDRFVNLGTPGCVHVDTASGLTRTFIRGTLDDNPTLTKYDPLYAERLKALPDIEMKRLLLGDWDSFAGQMFPQLSQTIHGCAPFSIPPEWKRFMVLDWGFAKPFSAGWYAVDYDGVLYRYREYYGSSSGGNIGERMIAEDVAREILRREDESIRVRLADPSIFHKRPKFREGESRGVTIADDFKAQGVYFLKADNDRVQGLQQVHKRLSMDTHVDKATGEYTESPRVQIFNDQEHFWRTMNLIQESEKNADDADTDTEDHVYDEFRYACMHTPIRSVRPATGAPVGSFSAERARLIRAKAYAKRNGTSLDAAYARIR